MYGQVEDRDSHHNFCVIGFATIHYHESGDLITKDGEQRMAMLPKITGLEDEVTIGKF